MMPIEDDAFAPGSLTLYLDNREPVSAAQLSEVLRALASEYKRQTRGGELIIARADSGSLKIIFKVLKTGFTIAAVAVTLHDFAEIVGKHVTLTREHGVDQASRAAGNRSAVEIFQLAAQSDSDVRFEYSGPNGETLRAEFTASDARRAVEHPRRSYKAGAVGAGAAAGRPNRAVAAPSGGDAAWMDPFIRDLKRGPGGELTEDNQTLLAIAIEALRRHGPPEALTDFARRLDKDGFHKEAVIARQAAR